MDKDFALLALLILLVSSISSSVIIWNERYQQGYDDGYSDTPRNVVEVDNISISRTEDDYYHFTLTAGNQTITVARIAGR